MSRVKREVKCHCGKCRTFFLHLQGWTVRENANVAPDICTENIRVSPLENTHDHFFQYISKKTQNICILFGFGEPVTVPVVPPADSKFQPYTGKLTCN